MRIDSTVQNKEDFYKILKLKMRTGTRLEKKTAQVISLDLFFNRDFFCGEINEDTLWVMRPRRIRLPFAQRVFSGFYSEADGHVVVYGSFRFSSYDKWLSIIFSAIISFLSLFIMIRLPMLSPVIAVIISLLIGASFWGVIIVVDLFTSRRCEEDVIRLLSSPHISYSKTT